MPNNRANTEVNPGIVYSKFLQPACTVAVTKTTRKKLKEGRSLPKWTVVHLLARMRKKKGCNVPPRVRYGSGTITSLNLNHIKRMTNKVHAGKTNKKNFTQAELNTADLLDTQGKRLMRRQALRDLAEQLRGNNNARVNQTAQYARNNATNRGKGHTNLNAMMDHTMLDYFANINAQYARKHATNRGKGHTNLDAMRDHNLLDDFARINAEYARKHAAAKINASPPRRKPRAQNTNNINNILRNATPNELERLLGHANTRNNAGRRANELQRMANSIAYNNNNANNQLAEMLGRPRKKAR